MLRPYGLACAYPSESRERVGVGLSSLAERCGTGGWLAFGVESPCYGRILPFALLYSLLHYLLCRVCETFHKVTGR